MLLKNFNSHKNFFLKAKLLSVFFSFRNIVFFEFDNWSIDFFNFKSLCLSQGMHSMVLLAKFSKFFFSFSPFFFHSSIILVFTKDLRKLSAFFLSDKNTYLPHILGLCINHSFLFFKQHLGSCFLSDSTPFIKKNIYVT